MEAGATRLTVRRPDIRGQFRLREGFELFPSEEALGLADVLLVEKVLKLIAASIPPRPRVGGGA
jgi:hypothetical protein